MQLGRVIGHATSTIKHRSLNGWRLVVVQPVNVKREPEADPIVAVDKLVRNSTAKVGDVLFLTKPIGNGILVSAYRALSGRKFFRRSAAPNVDAAIEWMTSLNAETSRLMVETGASAATDITGYGLVGHLLEMCDGSGVGATIRVSAVPVLDGAREYLARGHRPSGTVRNVETFRRRVRLSIPENEFTLMCDAQTSGGLLIAISSEREGALEQRLRQGGLFYAKVGEITADTGRVTLEP